MTLIEAVRSGNLDRVNAEIAAGADVNLPADDATPLAFAAAAGRKDIVRALVRAGADANWQTENGDTAMMLAALAGQTAICEYLAILTEPSECQRAIQHLHAITPPDINDRIDDFIAAAATGEAIALHAAAEAGDLSRVRSLLDAGVDPNQPNPVRKQSSLVQAAFKGHVEILRLLLAAGADVNGLPGESFNPLSAAAYYGWIEVVQILIEAGADVNVYGSLGTALDHARKYQYTEMIQLLEAVGAKTTEDLEGEAD